MAPKRRRITTDAVKHELLVFAEGEVTEENYLMHYHRMRRQKVKVAIDDFRGGPLQLVQRAIEAKTQEEKDERRGRGRAHDEYWCVFDVDEHPNFKQAVSLARDHGIKLAISSPCIELWFLLHFEDQTAYIERHKAQAEVRRHGCEKSLSPAVLADLEENYETARGRACKLDEKHRGDGSGPHANPGSGMWRIVDSIVER